MAGSQVRERILDTATGLFAELGYDEVTVRMIAETAGLTFDEVIATIGTKRDLYVLVMDRAAALEDGMLAKAAAEFTHDVAGMHRFLDRYLDFYVTYPHIAALWIQRRMFDAADITHIESQISVPQLRLVAESVGSTFGPGVDVELALWSIAWCVQDFVQGGIPTEDGKRVGRNDPQTLARFRTHLHSMLLRMVGYPD
jgi:AcrR family transcriptional regulator